MKILSLADAANIHTQKWARYLASRGHELKIISFRPARLNCAQVHYINTGVVRTEGGNWHYLLGLPAVRRHILQMGPDLVFCHYLTSYGLIGALLKSRLPLVIWLHGTDVLVAPSRSPLHRLMARYALARSDLLIMSADHMKQRVQQLVGVGKRTIVVPVGADLRKFNQTKPSERKKLTCISNRRLVKNSNVDLLLEAVDRVRQVQPEVRLTIVGDGPLRPGLKSAVRRLDLTPWVTFLGKVPYEVMPDLLRRHSLYLSATNSDGTSISLLEAMACGTFPIVSDIPANQPWIASGTNGFLVPLDRPDLFTRRILEAFGSPQLMSSAQPANCDIVKERGDYLSNMERAERAMEQLLATDGRRLEEL